jgi:hypothetical protein
MDAVSEISADGEILVMSGDGHIRAAAPMEVESTRSLDADSLAEENDTTEELSRTLIQCWKWSSLMERTYQQECLVLMRQLLLPWDHADRFLSRSSQDYLLRQLADLVFPHSRKDRGALSPWKSGLLYSQIYGYIVQDSVEELKQYLRLPNGAEYCQAWRLIGVNVWRVSYWTARPLVRGVWGTTQYLILPSLASTTEHVVLPSLSYGVQVTRQVVIPSVVSAAQRFYIYETQYCTAQGFMWQGSVLLFVVLLHHFRKRIYQLYKRQQKFARDSLDATHKVHFLLALVMCFYRSLISGFCC